MKLSVSILCFNQLETTKKCVAHLLKTQLPIQDIEFILTDNGSSDGTADYLRSCGLPNSTVIVHPENLGFGEGHNRTLSVAKGEFLLLLNNDMMIKDSDWMERSLFHFKNPQVALVGLAGTPCSLKSDGQGFLGVQKDYVEGCFMIGRTELFRKYGLFSPRMKMMCFDDSDVTLRFRQMGFKTSYCRMSCLHLHSVTQKSIDREYRRRIVTANQKTFLSRWSSYITTKAFKNKILVQFPSIGIGDIIAATPVLGGLRLDHPTAEIHVESHFPEIFVRNPLVASTKILSKPRSSDWDRVLNLNPNYGAKELLQTSYVDAAFTTVPDLTPQLYLSELEKEGAELFLEKKLAIDCQQGAVKVLIAGQMNRIEWQGRRLELGQTKALVQELKRVYGRAVFLIEIGKDVVPTGAADLDLINKTSLRESFAITSAVDVVLTIDSLFLHLAQAFKKPTIGVFGATRARFRVPPGAGVKEITHPMIQCVGCYHEKVKPGFNKCDRQDEFCMFNLSPEYLLTEIRDSQIISA